MPYLILEQLGPRTRKGDLLRLLEVKGGLSGNRVGQIQLAGGIARIEVPSGWDTRLAQALDGAELHGRRITAMSAPDERSTAWPDY
jgi:hypothetical protein